MTTITIGTKEYELNPLLAFRNGNPETDLGLNGKTIKENQPAIVLKADFEALGNDAPALPIWITEGNSIYGPYLQVDEGWAGVEYLVHLGQIYERVFHLPSSDKGLISQVLEKEAVTLPLILAKLEKSRKQIAV